jgi:sulfate/thiosulfate transport system permease protein
MEHAPDSGIGRIVLENFGWLGEKSDRPVRPAVSDPAWVQWGLIAISIGFMGLFLFLPLAAVFVEAFAQGAHVYFAAITSSEAAAAIRLTLLTAAIVVPLNVTFGLAAAWTLTRFEFPGKQALLTVIDLPFSVSPVISGMIFVLLLGVRTPIGGWLVDHGIQIIFAKPGIVLATLFVTFPIAARELIPVMQVTGRDEEEAAIVLGANGWQMFRRVTLPNVRWGLVYGVVLCAARAMGEFGAVSVVSGHIRGATNTMPLYVEILYNDYEFSAAFAVASLLALLALVTLALKYLVGRRIASSMRETAAAETVEQVAA